MRITIGENTTTTTIVLTVASLCEVVRGPASDHGVPGLLLSDGLTGQPSPDTVTIAGPVLTSPRLAVTEAIARSGLLQPVSLLLIVSPTLISLIRVGAGVLSL